MLSSEGYKLCLLPSLHLRRSSNLNSFVIILRRSSNLNSFVIILRQNCTSVRTVLNLYDCWCCCVIQPSCLLSSDSLLVSCRWNNQCVGTFFFLCFRLRFHPFLEPTTCSPCLRKLLLPVILIHFVRIASVSFFAPLVQ